MLSSQVLPIQRTTNTSTPNCNNPNDTWFDPFNFAPGQDQNIRWLNRPNQQLLHAKYSHDFEKFHIKFDAENFQPDQIKIYIQNHQLTITGVYEEHSEGRHMQKQFEKSFDIPHNADVELMACYITPAHMLVADIPLNQNFHEQLAQTDYLKVNNNMNDSRRLSFSLNKFNTLNEQGLLSSSSSPNNLSPLPPSGQQVRRTSITKTTTTTTGTTGLPPEATELLRSAQTTNGGTHSYSTHVTERRGSNINNQQIHINEPSPSTITKADNQTTSSSILTSADLANLPIEIPPELLATGGTITIQKRRVSVIKTVEPATHSTLSTTTNTITESQQSTTSSDRHHSKSTGPGNRRRTLTLEEFLQNRTWNPTIIDGSHGKKILSMCLQMRPGTTPESIRVTLNGYDLRIELDNKLATDSGRLMNQHSYRQITLFHTCQVEQLTTELKDDGFLYIHVPIKL
ncbi:unnamed protein product [Adineta steineri]|uniref:SHSP domain-containing protein n=1 Tax=Adineta steineri TaxID=433720 RepID=A0A815ICB7_9BILA|nr:unnamed protein product [Adineta steineri]CAF1366609.1 unnamed protein product [Adineta steineri]CAF1380154.1 unnamed protein product [Adineta steineri]